MYLSWVTQAFIRSVTWYVNTIDLLARVIEYIYSVVCIFVHSRPTSAVSPLKLNTQ